MPASKEFHQIPLAAIKVDRDERQRRSLGNLESLKSSIARVGLINPVVVTRDLTLVAGERRLAAMTELKWDLVPCQYIDELEPDERFIIELEENSKRLDLPWRDNVKAVATYHNLQQARNPGWTGQDTAQALSLSPSHVWEMRTVQKAIDDGDEHVSAADSFSAAYGICERKTRRLVSKELDNLGDGLTVIQRQFVEPETALPAVRLTAPEVIKCGSFFEWVKTYKGPPFTLIHLDPPYGINHHKSDQGGSKANESAYRDSPELFWEFIITLTNNLDKLLYQQGHLLIWFSMVFYSDLVAVLDNNIKKKKLIVPHPLVWLKSDNKGILSDPTRRPRHIYETCLMVSVGDCPVVQAVSDAYACPTSGQIREHLSEKPEPMLRHFLRMLVDGSSEVLDPSCGSGSALRAADSLGAQRVLGIELNPHTADVAQDLYRQAWNKRKLAEDHS